MSHYVSDVTWFSQIILVCTTGRIQAFSVVFQKAVLKAEPDEALKQRVSNLIDSITSSVFQYTTRGLFECDKLTYIAQLAFQVRKRSSAWFVLGASLPSSQHLLRPAALFESNQVESESGFCWKDCRLTQSPTCLLCPQILLMNKEINPAELDFLLRYPVQPGVTSPVDFLSNHSWGGIKVQRGRNHFWSVMILEKSRALVVAANWKLSELWAFFLHHGLIPSFMKNHFSWKQHHELIFSLTQHSQRKHVDS